MSAFLPHRTAVLSPHLDDGVLSLGASIARATRAGSYVRIVTVFSGDPYSERAASGWDALPGFSSEGQAVRARRAEDAEACRLVGADRRYLPFSEPVYAGVPDVGALLAAVTDAVRDVDAVLVPGFPLIHRDHRWVTRSVLADGLDVTIGVYAEQPYRHTKARFRCPTLAADLRPLLLDEPRWERGGSNLDGIRAKQRAVSAYRTQLRWLGLQRTKLAGMLVFEAIGGGESRAWVKPVAGSQRFAPEP